ncbi:PAS domain S-box protein [Roseiconus nitratireducens]|nr:PAS domain S-box protein [Roseiconus nitratireducens]
MSREDIQKLVHELQVHQMELEIQNEELRRAQTELACSRDRFADLYDFAPVGYLTLDRHGVILEANLTAATMLGVERNGLVNRKLTDFLPDQAKEAWHLHRRTVFADSRNRVVELPLRASDGRPQRIRLESRACSDADGSVNRCRSAMIDIAEQEIAKEAFQRLNINLGQSLVGSETMLNRSIEHVRLLTEAVAHLGEGILITNDDLDWPGPQIVFVNDALCRITGYTSEELIGQSPRILQGDATDRDTLERIKSELAAGRSVLFELANYRKDGTPYDAELFITPLFDSDGRRTNFVAIHRDITKRKQSEEGLRREHELSEGIIASSQHIIVLLDTEGRIKRFNPYLEELAGWQLAEVRGRDWFEVFVPERERRSARGLFDRSLRGERTRGEVNSIVAKDGRELRIEWYDAPLTSADGEFNGLLCTGQDVTERLQDQQALREREERLQAVLNTAADAIINIDRDGVITDVNPATERLFGYTEQELIGQNIKILMPSPYCDEHDDYLARYRETGEARIIGSGREVAGKRKDGSTFPIDLAVSEVDHLDLFTGIIRDSSERKMLLRDLVGIAEDEQRRIGQDLHDGTQQELAGLGMLAQTLLNNLTNESGDQPDASRSKQRSLAQRIVEGIDRAHREVQTVSRGLVPGRLDQMGLVEALRELASRTDQLSGITCAFKCERPIQIGDDLTATHLYRIAQEALTNALKHARPEHILVALEYEDGQIVLRVADDGKGFDLARRSDGMGLKTMQYRASLIGAGLTVEAVETGGTLVSCTVADGEVQDDDR